MEALDLLVVVVFFLIGYWVIGALWPKSWTRRKNDGITDEPEDKRSR